MRPTRNMSATQRLTELKLRVRSFRRRLLREVYRGYGPMPHTAKMAALKHVFVDGATVVETGTFLGDSSYFLARQGFRVHTIEVSPSLSERVFPLLRRNGVQCYCGDSAVVLAALIPRLIAEGNSALNFWLDGHWSGGITGKAQNYETPIVGELGLIAAQRSKLSELVVVIDDLRLFGNDPAYPPKSFLTEWAASNGLQAYWLPDMFVASTRSYADL